MTDKIKLTTTLKLLKEANACSDGYKTLIDYLGHDYGDSTEINVLTILKSNGIDHFFWTFRVLQQDRKIYAPILNNIIADIAESVLCLFEEKYPEDKRPRLAIVACRESILSNVAWAAAWAATDARAAARAAAWAVAEAAEAAAWAAGWAEVQAAAWAAEAAADARAAWAAWAADARAAAWAAGAAAAGARAAAGAAAWAAAAAAAGARAAAGATEAEVQAAAWAAEAAADARAAAAQENKKQIEIIHNYLSE